MSDRPVKRATRSEQRIESASLMLQRLTSGKTVADLAAANGVSEKTVRRRLANADANAGLLASMQAILAQDMLPRALTVLQEALDSDDLKLAVSVALRIVDSFGFRTLGTPERPAEPAEPGSSRRTEDSLELWREKLTLTRRTQPADAAPTPLPERIDAAEEVSLRPAPIDGSLVEIPAATPDPKSVRPGSSESSLPSGE